MSALDILTQHRACGEARDWLGKRTPKQAWDECPRGDWMLWIAARIGITMVGRAVNRHYLLFTGKHRFVKAVSPTLVA